MARIAGLFLAAWSGGFAVLHLAWAVGSRLFLPDEFAPIATRPWFLAYDVVAGLLMFAAAGVAWQLAHGDRRRRLRAATLVGSVLALLRGAPALVSDLVADDVTGIGLFADVWFTAAGLAGLALYRASAAHTELVTSAEARPARPGPGGRVRLRVGDRAGGRTHLVPRPTLRRTNQQRPRQWVMSTKRE